MKLSFRGSTIITLLQKLKTMVPKKLIECFALDSPLNIANDLQHLGTGWECCNLSLVFWSPKTIYTR